MLAKLLMSCCLVITCLLSKLIVAEEGLEKKLYPSTGPIGQEFRDIAYELRCPTCTGLSVLESDAKFSVQIKDIVLEQVNAGKSKDEVLRYFTDRYGSWILRTPPKSGYNLLAWAIPMTLLTLGPLLVWLLVWRRKKVVVNIKVRPTNEIINEMNQRIEMVKLGLVRSP